MVQKTALKTTAVQAPNDDNHTTVLKQLKEVVEVGQRLRGDPNDSFVRVKELTDAGIMRLVNGTLQPPTSTSLPGAVVPASRNVNTVDSLTGGGALAADLTLSLVGDVSSPGNNMVYGTNGSGVRGWYSASGGSGTLSGLSDVLISSPSNGQVLTYDSGSGKWKNQNSSGGSAGYPGTLNDLQYWWSADIYKMSSGKWMAQMSNQCPWMPGLIGNSAGIGATLSATQLNSLNVMTFVSGGNSRYNLLSGLNLHQSTAFAVYKPSSIGTTATFFSGGSGALQFRVETSGKLSLVKSNVAGVGTSTSGLSVGTWYQVNYTYDDSTGVFAFRTAQATNGGGTNAVGITATSGAIGYNPPPSGEDLTGDLAELIIYARVLSGTEIGNVESYLHSKWGV